MTPRFSTILATCLAIGALAARPAVATVLPSQCPTHVGEPCANLGDGCHVGVCTQPSSGTAYCNYPSNSNPCKDNDCAHGCQPDQGLGHTCVTDGNAHDQAGADCTDHNDCTTDQCDGLGSCVSTAIDCAAKKGWSPQCGTITCAPSGGCHIDTTGTQGTTCSDGKDCTYSNGNFDICDGSGHCGATEVLYRSLGTICWSNDIADSTAGDDGAGHTWCISGTCGDPGTSNKGKCLGRTNQKAENEQCGDYGNNCMNRHCTAGGACPAPTPGSECLTSGSCANAPCAGITCGGLPYTYAPAPCACSGIDNY